MLRTLRSALARFAVRRAAACQRFTPKRADFWLRMACRFTPVLAEPYPALLRLRRAGGRRGLAPVGDAGAGRAGPAVGRARGAAGRGGEARGLTARRSELQLDSHPSRTPRPVEPPRAEEGLVVHTQRALLLSWRVQAVAIPEPILHP